MDNSTPFRPSSPAEIKAVMQAELLQIMGSVDNELISELAQLFMDEYPSKLAAATVALATSDLKQLQEIAHSLKGSSSNMGLRRFSQLCHDLHLMARNEERDQAVTQLEYVKAEFRAAEQILAEYL